MDLNMNESSDINPGEPVTELAGFEEETPYGLLARVRRSILRRTAAAQMTSFWWSTPLLILREFWIILLDQVNPTTPRKDK